MKKKLLTLILLLVTVFGVFGVANTKEVNALGKAGEILYLVPSNNWKEANAWFAAYFFKGNTNAWAKMSDDDGDGIYSCTIPKGTWSNVIFVRKNPANTGLDWNGNWGQTADLTFGGNLYNVINWNASGSGWKTHSVNLAGSFNNWNASANTFSDSNGDGVYEYTIELAAGSYEFKIIENGNWLGNATTITDDCTGLAYKNNSSLGNTKFTVSGGVYNFTFTANTNKLNIKSFTYEKCKEQLDESLKLYYDGGTYTKETIININTANEDLKEELIQRFHAAINSLDRVQTKKTTYYSGDILWFADGHGYGKSEDNKLTSIKVEGNDPTKVTVRSTTASLPGMEDYYCTLDDFVKGLHNSKHSNNENLDLVTGWTYDSENKVYKNTTSDVIDAFILFTAPTWLDTDMGNYLEYSHVTIQVVNNQLVMKLWVSKTAMPVNGEGGKLVADAEVVGDYAVFSQATVSKGIVA